MSWRAPGRRSRSRAGHRSAPLELLSCAPPDFARALLKLCPHADARPRRGFQERALHDRAAARGRSLYGSTGRAAGGHSGPPLRRVLLLPVDTLFAAHPALTLTPAQEKCCRNGASFTLPLHPRPLSPVPPKAAISRPRRGQGQAHGDRERAFCDLRRMHINTTLCIGARLLTASTSKPAAACCGRTRENGGPPRRSCGSADLRHTSGCACLRSQRAAAERRRTAATSCGNITASMRCSRCISTARP